MGEFFALEVPKLKQFTSIFIYHTPWSKYMAQSPKGMWIHINQYKVTVPSTFTTGAAPVFANAAIDTLLGLQGGRCRIANQWTTPPKKYIMIWNIFLEENLKQYKLNISNILGLIFSNSVLANALLHFEACLNLAPRDLD